MLSWSWAVSSAKRELLLLHNVFTQEHAVYSTLGRSRPAELPVDLIVAFLLLASIFAIQVVQLTTSKMPLPSTIWPIWRVWIITAVTALALVVAGAVVICLRRARLVVW